MTSFAAPTGDAKLGVSNGVSKPIGSSANDDDEDEDSESDDETFADNGKDEDGEETDSKFQLQDGGSCHPVFTDLHLTLSSGNRRRWRTIHLLCQGQPVLIQR